VTTFLFTDIEGSTRLWEQEPERMKVALARHDALARDAVSAHGGTVVKTTGDGIHAVFDDPLGGVAATIDLLRSLADPQATGGLPISIRCGLHVGAVQRRDGDYYGTTVNRAARIMSTAHGGQVLLSGAVAAAVEGRLPEAVTLRDLGAVRLRDLAQPERLYQVVHPALRLDFPALRSLEATPNNLPQQVTSFVGRERELGEVKALLGQTRMLTLLGIGGLGKTRLSLQAAVESMDDYPDGVWFVELAALTDPHLVPQAVASALGVTEEAGRPVVEALQRYAKDRRALLILDNSEHLLQACAELAETLLRSGPNVRILASSREPLRVPGETTYHVPPLGVPDARTAATPEALAGFESVRLFVDRAMAVQPAFRVTGESAPAVAEICRRLDGIPLALELAAARVRMLSPEKIAERLNDRFHLLTGGSRTALPRQQTLRALIDWSYDLLTGPERALLRRLAVFAAGWTLEAAEAVGAGGEIGAADVLDLLGHLVDKSLVVTDANGERYRLLDTVRQYAQERLVEAGESNDARARHLAFYLELAEQAKPQLVGPQQASWLARLDLERENLLAAHAWCDDPTTAPELGLRLVDAVQSYWIIRGVLGLGHRVTTEALARRGAQARNRARCRVLFGAGWLGCCMGRYREAIADLEESLAIAREIGDSKRIAAVLQPLALASLGLGDAAAARGHAEEALVLARQGGEKRSIAAALINLAQVCRVQGEADAAEPLYESALELARELGDSESIAIDLLNLAMVAIDRGMSARAAAMVDEALTIVVETGLTRTGQSALDVCAGLAASRGEWEQAARFYGAAEGQTGQTGLRRDPSDEAFLVPLVERTRAALGDDAFGRADAAGRALAWEQAMAQARGWLAGGPSR
jgi:predicted ATPase/class 3 adenylate cyclase